MFPKGGRKAEWAKLDRDGGPESSKSSRVPTRPLSLTDGPVSGRVAGLSEHPRKPGRYRVAIALSAEALLGEGRRAQETVLVDAAVMQRFKLKVGAELDADAGEQLLASATALGTYDAATAALALRGRSRRELERWLMQRKHAASDIRSALERLDDLGFLNDESYARSYARAKMAGGKTSRRRIAMELSRKGIARELVDRVIREAGEEEGFDERGALEAAAERRARSLSKLEPEVARRRLMGFLLRRGFGGEEVRKVVQATFPR